MYVHLALYCTAPQLISSSVQLITKLYSPFRNLIPLINGRVTRTTISSLVRFITVYAFLCQFATRSSLLYNHL